MKNPIKHCKTCFKIIKSNSFYQIINGDSCLCDSCQNKLVPHFEKFEIDNVEGLAIYEYDDNFKSLLYQFKGCYDIELASVFLNRFKKELSLLYKSYILVAAPSYHLEDEKREFRHVGKMFECLNLPIYYPILKTSPFKQAEHKKKEREKIKEHLVLKEPNIISGKNILIVDDVSTTGSTLKAMIDLVNMAKPKKIKILVVSRRIIH